jgi:plasmid replication initiation protein
MTSKKPLKPLSLDDKIKNEILLKKAVELVHMTGNLTLAQKRMFNHLISYSFKDLGDTDTYRASVSKLVKDTGFDSKNLTALRATLKSIQRTMVSLDLLNDSKLTTGWADINLLSETRVLNGIITWSFPPTLRSLLNDPKVFAIISLSTEGNLKSVHSVNLYETILRFRNVHSTGFIDLSTWRKIIGATAPCYDSFKVFNATVLKPAIKEINNESEVTIEPFFEKLGRNVSAIRFSITEKPKNNSLVVKIEDEDIDPIREAIEQRLATLGLTDKQALSILGDYQLDYIKGNLDVVEMKIRESLESTDPEKKIKNYVGFFHAALKSDWRIGTATIDQDILDEKKAIEEKKQAEKKSEEQAIEKAQKVEKEIIKNRLATARACFNEMNPENQELTKTRFAEHLEEIKRFDWLKKFKSGGIDATQLIAGTFDCWIADEIDKGTIF